MTIVFYDSIKYWSLLAVHFTIMHLGLILVRTNYFNLFKVDVILGTWWDLNPHTFSLFHCCSFFKLQVQSVLFPTLIQRVLEWVSIPTRIPDCSLLISVYSVVMRKNRSAIHFPRLNREQTVK